MNWPPKFKQELKSLRNPSEDIKAYVEELANERAFTMAGEVLSTVVELKMPSPAMIVHAADGGIGLVWGHFEIECCNDSTFWVSYTDFLAEYSYEWGIPWETISKLYNAP